MKMEHPLRQLRKIINKTQEQFAAMLGVSKDAIVSVECGRIAFTPKMQRRVLVATGAKLSTGGRRFYGDGRPPKDLPRKLISPQAFKTGHDYSKEDFEKWRIEFRSNEQAAKDALADILPELEAMFIEAAKPGRAGIKDRLPALVFELGDWMAQTQAKFKLTSTWR